MKHLCPTSLGTAVMFYGKSCLVRHVCALLVTRQGRGTVHRDMFFVSFYMPRKACAMCVICLGHGIAHPDRLLVSFWVR